MAQLAATRLFPKRDPQEPLSPSEIGARFLDTASAVLTGSQAAELMRLVRGLPDAKDLARLSALLAV